MKYKIKVNDKVSVLSGKDKGKTGKVLQILPDMNKLVVEGINVMYKHIKSQKRGEKGQRVQFNGPINVSNIMFVCPKCNKSSRLGIKEQSETVATTEKKSSRRTKSRFCKKCNEAVD